jgi:hypothetical protein
VARRLARERLAGVASLTDDLEAVCAAVGGEPGYAATSAKRCASCLARGATGTGVASRGPFTRADTSIAATSAVRVTQLLGTARQRQQGDEHDASRT